MNEIELGDWNNTYGMIEIGEIGVEATANDLTPRWWIYIDKEDEIMYCKQRYGDTDRAPRPTPRNWFLV